ncbi:MAG TPA: ABC transporter substrate-binding protein [Anaerolineae bacterium]|nr:ABC transporter substrate-binding protein [Anaerolineae bacterium]
MNRQLMIPWTLLLCLVAASACGPTPTSLPSASTAALVSTAPTGLHPTSTPIATPQPMLEPVAGRFLYVEGVTVSTLAGDGHWGYRDGPGAQARFNGVDGIAVDGQGNLYVSERFGNRIRRVSPDGMVSTLAGTGVPGYTDGPAPSAQFRLPKGLAVDEAGNVYVADAYNHRIRVIHPDGLVSTLAGSGEAGYRDGPAAQAQFNRPMDVVLSASGVIYVADPGNNRVRAISPDGVVSTVAGSGERGYQDGPPDQAQFNGPEYLAVGPDGTIYASDGVGFEVRSNQVIRRITPEGTVSTLVGTGQPGLADGPLAEAGFFYPHGLDVDAAGNLYIGAGGNQRVRVITPQGMVYTLAGRGIGHADGPGPEAAFLYPYGVALDGAGRLYVANYGASRISIVHLPQALRQALPQSLVAAPPSPRPDPNTAQNVIKIGFVDNTGMAAFFCSATRNAAQLAIDEANAAGEVTVGGVRHTLALVRAQDWNHPPDAGAQAAARALVDQGVVAVVGHALSENSIAGAEVYGPAGVVMVSPMSSDPRLTEAGWPTVYRLTSNDAFMAPEAARMTYEELGIRRAVLLGEADPHVRTAMDAWQMAFESLGGQAVGRFEAEVEFPAEDMAQLKTLAPEAVIFFPARKLNVAWAVQQVLETGVGPVIVGVESFTAHAPTLADLGDATEGIYDAVPGRPHGAMPGHTGFAERYRQASFAILPDPDGFLAQWAPFGYDAAGVIIAAVRQAAQTGEVTPESVAAAMETFRHEPYQGVIGTIQFDEYGDLLDQPVYFKKMVNGQWVDVMPGER